MTSSIASPDKTASSIRPLAIYWTIGILVGLLYVRSDIAESVGWSGARVVSVLLALVATVVTTVAYGKITTTGGRSLHLPTLFGFSVANGICETLLFIASFKIGLALAAPFTTKPLWLFLAGTFTFFVYSGAIHALFWLKILPTHLNKNPATKNARRVWIAGLVAVSVLWGWLYFGYQDFWSFAILHILFDAGMVYCIRYRLA
ncbi:MAG: hypothetical protein AAFN40_25995 [Cyanobacteria bacterium J06560_6]